MPVVRGRPADLGDGTLVTRLLPSSLRRTVGPWCFADVFRATGIGDLPGMHVAPHPHVGLETVTYLVEGEVNHRDGLGNDAVVRPGELSLMTAGAGIAHSEHSPPGHGAVLHGVQLWIALPDELRHAPPAYRHVRALPSAAVGGLDCRVLLGSFAGVASPAAGLTPCVAAELVWPRTAGGYRTPVPLDPSYEHAVVVLGESVSLDGVEIGPGELAVLDAGADEVALDAPPGGRALLLGGAPFREDLLMWWNFVARTGEEIEDARSRWEHGGFDPVCADASPPVPAPPLPAGRLRARR